jgi:hypothetical protein
MSARPYPTAEVVLRKAKEHKVEMLVVAHHSMNWYGRTEIVDMSFFTSPNPRFVS